MLDPRVSAKPFLYTYDARASVVAQLAMPTGQTIAYARDAQGRLLSTTLSGTAHQTLATHAYTYDLAGQRTTASTASATTAYTYDALRQLATATETPAGTGQTPTQQFAYAYDPIGNRLTAATAAETTTYTANSVNQYTAIVSQISNSQISDTPTYDANGNTTTLPSGLVLDYDEENRLVSAATPTAREEYTYDGLGRRVERRTFTAAADLIAPATTTRYVYDGWRVLEELTSTQSSPFTLHSSYTRGLDLSGTLEGAGGIGGLLAMARGPAGSATSAYYLPDGNGNISALVSASDALVASYTYTPFGDTLTATGTWASVNAYRFSAKECDAFTGLYYYGFRYYNPSTGRWLSRDPLEERGEVNLYGMVRNHPTNAIDYLGREEAKSMGTLEQIHPDQANKLDVLIPKVPVPNSKNLLPVPDTFGLDAAGTSATAVNAAAAAPYVIYDNIFPALEYMMKDRAFGKASKECGAHSPTTICWCCQISIWPDSTGVWNSDARARGILYKKTCDEIKPTGPIWENIGQETHYVPW